MLKCPTTRVVTHIQNKPWSVDHLDHGPLIPLKECLLVLHLFMSDQLLLGAPI